MGCQGKQRGDSSHNCHAYRQDVLTSIGGVELLFPILEQVDKPLKELGGVQSTTEEDDIFSDQELTSVFNSTVD